MNEALRSLANVANAFSNTPLGPAVALLGEPTARVDRLAEAAAAVLGNGGLLPATA